jgi:N-acetyl-gamma-glutamylphosphate reductase
MISAVEAKAIAESNSRVNTSLRIKRFERNYPDRVEYFEGIVCECADKGFKRVITAIDHDDSASSVQYLKDNGYKVTDLGGDIIHISWWEGD